MQKSSATKWNNFITELANIQFFWMFCILFFLLFRSVFIILNLDAIGDTATISDYFSTFFMGFRFDATVSAYFLVIPFLALLLLSYSDKIHLVKKIRKIFQILFIILATLICIITINYYNEYNDQFNQFLFLGLYDDQKAVAKTILADFNPFLNLGLLILIGWLSFKIFRYFESKQKIATFLSNFTKNYQKIAIVLISLVLFVGSIRGGLGKNPAMLKWAFVSSDEFLNKTIINPFRALNYAIEDFKELNKPKGENPYGNLKLESVAAITAKLKKHTKGVDSIPTKPKQIFLVVMESYDSWPLMDKYEALGVATQLKKIESKAIRFANFLPSAQSTLNSFGAITTGVPYVGVNINQIGAINGPFKTSIFEQFKKLGYQTNFFYGGFLSWQNIGKLMKNQGADHLYSAPNAGGKTESGVWGIEDEKLFDLVYKTVDKTKNSINVILTTSYHPPYKVAIYKEGFPYKTIADLPIKAQKYYSGAMSFKALGHLWYSDKVIGKFVKKAEQKYPEALFCFTGDHYGRRFVNAKPSLQERSSVPFIIYGKNIVPSVNNTPGSHIDIAPTLIEMVAPKNFEYFSFGESLLNNEHKKFGFSQEKIITKQVLEHFKNDNVTHYDLSSNKAKQLKTSNFKAMKNKRLQEAWYYTVHKNDAQ